MRKENVRKNGVRKEMEGVREKVFLFFCPFLGSGPVGDDDLWHPHIGIFSLFSFSFLFSFPSPPGASHLASGPSQLAQGPSQLALRPSQLAPRLTQLDPGPSQRCSFLRLS